MVNQQKINRKQKISHKDTRTSRRERRTVQGKKKGTGENPRLNRRKYQTSILIEICFSFVKVYNKKILTFFHICNIINIFTEQRPEV